MEEIPINEYAQLINDLYGSDDERREIANAKLSEFQANQTILTLQYSAQLLTEHNDDFDNILTFSAISVKNFFTQTAERTFKVIQNQWDDLNPEFCVYLKEALTSKMQDTNETLRNVIVQAIATLCLYDREFYETISSSQLMIIKEQLPQTELSIPALTFFNDLLQTGFYSNGNQDPEFITQLRELIVPIYFDDCDQSLRELSLRVSISLVGQCPEVFDNPEVLTFILGNTQIALETITYNDYPILQSLVYTFISNITFNFYEHFFELNDVLKPLVIDSLECTDPDNAALHSDPHFHEKHIYVIWYWQELALYEKGNNIENGVIIQLIDHLISCVIHLMRPYDPEDETIEDKCNPQTSFYASVLMDSLCQLDTQLCFTKLAPILDAMDPSDTGNLHVFLQCASSIAKGERTDAITEWFDQTVLKNIIPLKCGTNQRLRETLIYCVYQIIKKHAELQQQEFETLLDFIDENKFENIEIRLRLQDLLRVMLQNVHNSELIDAYFDRVLSLVLDLSGQTIPDVDQNDITYRPMNSLYLLISKSSNSDDNAQKFMHMLTESCEALQSETCEPVIIGHVIVIGGLAKKLGRSISEHTNSIVNLLLELLSQNIVDLWKETLFTILIVLETGPVDPQLLPRFTELIDNSVGSADNVLISSTIRCFGKFVSVSYDPQFDEQLCEAIGHIRSFIDDLEAACESGMALGVSLACVEISKIFTAPEECNREIAVLLIDIANTLMDTPLFPDLPKVINSVLCIYTNIFSCARRSPYEADAKMNVKKYALFIEKIYKVPEFMQDNIIKNGSAGLVFAGRAFKTSVNHWINRAKVISFVKKGKDSRNQELSEFCKQCLDEIQKL